MMATGDASSSSLYWDRSPLNTIIMLPSCAISLLFSLSCSILGAGPRVRQVKALSASSKSTYDRRRLAVVTGSNTGVGYETAKTLVLEHNIDVILACRSRDKALQAIETINEEAALLSAAKNNNDDKPSSARAHFILPLDLSSFDSIRTFCVNIHEKHETVDILINNAGRNTEGGMSVDNLSTLFQANYWGHFLLSNLLLDLFPKDGTGRIVNLSSVMHHFLEKPALDDEAYWKRQTQDHPESYCISKLAAILFTQELNRRYYDKNMQKDENDRKKIPSIRSFAVNPGAVNSDIWREYPRWIIPLFKLVFLNTSQGCSTSIAAAVGKFENEDEEGAFYLQPYWIPKRYETKEPVFTPLEILGPYAGYSVTQPRVPKDDNMRAAKALWKVSEEVTGCQYPVQ